MIRYPSDTFPHSSFDEVLYSVSRFFVIRCPLWAFLFLRHVVFSLYEIQQGHHHRHLKKYTDLYFFRKNYPNRHSPTFHVIKFLSFLEFISIILTLNFEAITRNNSTQITKIRNFDDWNRLEKSKREKNNYIAPGV